MKGMAAAEPFQCKPNTAEGAVLLDRFAGVFRAGWVEAAAVADKGA